MKNLYLLVITCILFPSLTNAQLAKGKGKYLGNVYSEGQVQDFAKYWNQVTPENAGKWGSVEAVRDVMNWTELDKAYKLAKDNGFYYKHHTLIWGNQFPAWITDLSTSEQLEEIIEWYEAVAKRYPDIDAIEVVNEPINDPPLGINDGFFAKALGGQGQTTYDWVIEAYKLARKYFPNAKLVINEYGIENNVTTLNKYITLINLLKDRKLVDHVGFQAHAFNTANLTSASLKIFLDKLAEPGFPIFATEIDIDGPTDQKQLDDFKKLIPVMWEHPKVFGLTFWGWRPGLWRNAEKAFFHDGTKERPALEWLRTYIASAVLADIKKVVNQESISISPNPIGNGEVVINAKAEIENIELYDLSGKKVQLYLEINNNRFLLPAHIVSGQYVLKLFNKTGYIGETKLLVAR
jgi:endo-1,4-beta-xylanase